MLGVEHAYRLFPEQAAQQRGHVCCEQFLAAQCAAQRQRTVPGVCCRFRFGAAHGVTAFERQLLQQHAARDTAIGREPELGVQLFRTLHVVLDHRGHVLAVERDDALIRLLPRHFFLRVERDDEAAVAVDIDQFDERGIVVNLGVFTQLGRGTQLQRIVALHHQQAHRAVAVNLHHHGAIELQVGRQQGGSGHHLAQHALDRSRIIAPRQYLAPGVGQFHQLATHGRLLEHEFLQRVDFDCFRHYPIRFRFSLKNFPRAT